VKIDVEQRFADAQMRRRTHWKKLRHPFDDPEKN
jgi:hypothetical protein